MQCPHPRIRVMAWTLVVLLSGCEQMEMNDAPEAGPPELGHCAPDETAAACETSCTRLGACDPIAWSDADHWSCTRQCVEQLFVDDSAAKKRVGCLLGAGDACCDVEACPLELPAAVATAPSPPPLPYAEGTTNYCEIAANAYFLCGSFTTSHWTPKYFVNNCSGWGSGFQRKVARCTVKNTGNCKKVNACYSLPGV